MGEYASSRYEKDPEECDHEDLKEVWEYKERYTEQVIVPCDCLNCGTEYVAENAYQFHSTVHLEE